MSILVTGGTGLIGSNVARALVDIGREVIILDRQSFPSDINNVLYDVSDKYKLVIGNVADLAYLLNIIKTYHVEGIIHLATMAASAALEHPVEALQVNIIGAANMIEAARIMNLKRVILTSSASVYGAVEYTETPLREEDIILPASGMYALTKLTIEQLTYTYRELYGVDVVALRPGRTYGPGEGGHLIPHPIYKMVLSAVEGKPFRQSSGGDSAYEYSYVKDFARGAIQAYDCPRLNHHVYNLGFGGNRKMSDVAEILRNLFPNLTIELGPGLWPGSLPKGLQKDLVHRSTQRPPTDNTRARKDFGYNSEWPIERAIPDWIKWLKQRVY
ncbi:NAD-dependent epimerase/dehydratase family protein [Chloroflexota bacterium]